MDHPPGAIGHFVVATPERGPMTARVRPSRPPRKASEERVEFGRLKRENRQLKLEREILAKAVSQRTWMSDSGYAIYTKCKQFTRSVKSTTRAPQRRWDQTGGVGT